MKISIQTIVFNALSVLPEGMLQKNIEQWLDIADEIIGPLNGTDTVEYTP